MQTHSPLVAYNDEENNYSKCSFGIDGSDTAASALHTRVIDKEANPQFCNTVPNAC